MNKTPRTDAELKFEAFFDGAGIVETVEVDFARQLEAELADKDKQLAEARAEIERLDYQRRAGWTEIKRLNELIEQMREALKTVVSSARPSGPLWHGSAEIEKAVAAIKAAERGEGL